MLYLQENLDFMMRTVLIPDNTNVLLPIPKEYVGKEVEIIAFTKEQPAVSKKATFNSCSISTTGYKFDRNEANQR